MEDWNGKSLSERKKKMFEDCCGGMSVGADGYQADAAPEGPVAGYDPLQKVLARRKRRKNKETK
jgi:hypothetical protein